MSPSVPVSIQRPSLPWPTIGERAHSMTHPFPDLDRCTDALAGDLAGQPQPGRQVPGDDAVVASVQMIGDMP